MESFLRFRNVGRTHGSGSSTVHALLGANLELGGSELVAVVGPSGSGKSTLLSLAGALDFPTTGAIEIAGKDISKLKPSELARLRRREIGVVFQAYNLLPTLTAAENAALPLELDGCSQKAARQESLEALARLGMAGLADRYPGELSGGQQQRVSIARALIGTRRIILADEPTGALDSATGDEVIELLRAACAEGAAGLMVTHNLEYAALADRVIRLRDGRIESDVATDAVSA